MRRLLCHRRAVVAALGGFMAAALLWSGASRAASFTTTVFNFNGITNSTAVASYAADATPAGTTVGNVTRSAALGSAGMTGAFSARTWSTGVFDGTKYFTFTIQPASGFTLTLTQLAFDLDRSTQGPVSYAVRSSADSFAADLATGSVGTTFATKTVALGSAFANLSASVEFRIYGYGAGSTAGNMDIDNIALAGTSLAVSTTTPAAASASYSASNQALSLSATVASGGGTVNTGTVTFTVKQGVATVGSPVTSGTVTSGTASATFTLPGGTAAGSYTIQAAYTDGTSFTNSSGNAGLTVNQAATATSVSNAAATFSNSNQSVPLNATVTSAAGTVNTGTITFTVKQGATIIGSPVTSGAVTGGNASAIFILPGGAAIGTYTIQASYSGDSNLAGSADAAHTLVVSQATTATVASNATATFSTASQNVTLNAVVTSAAGAVNSGTVMFTIKQGATTIGSPVTSSTVTGGNASAVFTLPGGTAAGSYTIQAAYSGDANLAASSDAAHSLAISQAATTTVTSNASATFSSSNQNVALNAMVTSAGAVNEGAVTFTVKQGATVIGSPVTSGTVTSGTASATYVLPGGTAASDYTISAVYAGGTNFASSSGTNLLTVNQAASETSASSAAATFSGSNQSVSLNAAVTSAAGVVNSGTVTFTVKQGATVIGSPVTSSPVSSGNASATFTLPGGTAAGGYTIQAGYSGDANLAASSDATHSLTVSQAATTTAAGNATATFSSSSQPVSLSATVTSTAGTVSSGTVTFTVKQGITVIGLPVTSGTVTSGNASAAFTLPGGATAGTYTIQAVYNGDANLAGSSDTTHTLVVGPAATTTAAGNAAGTFSATSQNVALSATVTSAAGTVNSGSVTFTVKQGVTVIGSPVTSGTVTGGAAAATFVLPGGTVVGSYAIEAAYSGDSNLSGSSDAAHRLTVSAASTLTSAASVAAIFSASNQNVALSAMVTSAAGTVNEGIVTFTVKQGATVIGSAVTSGTVAGGNASATFMLPGGAAVGGYTIDAAYTNGTNFAGSSGTSLLTITPATTVTAASSAAATFNSGNQNVTLNATVTSAAGAVNTGTVAFTVKQGAATIGSSALSGTVSGGLASATFILPGGTAAGGYTIEAVYSGGMNFSGSSDAAHNLTVNQAATATTSAGISLTFSSSSQNVNLSAMVTSAAGAVGSGTVTFTVKQGAAVVGSPVTSGTVASGNASASFSLPGGTTAGTYAIEAVYSGDVNLAGSSDGAHTLVVSQAATTAAATNATATFSGGNQNVTLSATVTSAAGVVNEGTVTFTVKQGAVVVGSAVTSGAVAGGNASAMFVLPGGTAAGSYTINAAYTGGVNFAGSNGAGALMVNQAATTTQAANGSALFSAGSQNLTLSTVVSSGGGTVNAGTVTFAVKQGALTIGSPVTSGAVTNGTASAIYVLPGGTAAGLYEIQAVYSGAANFTGSSDSTHTLAVGQVGTLTTLASSANPALAGQAVTFTATVGTSPGGLATPTGTVQFSDNGIPLGSPTSLSNGRASLSLPSLAFGTHAIRAEYGGAASFLASNAALSQIVNRAENRLIDPITCSGPGTTFNVEAQVVSGGSSQQGFRFTAQLPAPLVAQGGSVLVSGGSNVSASATLAQVRVMGLIGAGETLTVRYRVQIKDNAAYGTPFSITSVVEFDGDNNGSYDSTQTVTADRERTVNCTDAGEALPPMTPASGQKAGSVLIYPLYTSRANAALENTRFNLTNTSSARGVTAHMFFVDGATCAAADTFVCLTPNQTLSFLASDYDPGVTGYLIIVAVDTQTGCPIDFNKLTGDAFVKTVEGYAANLGAEAFAAKAGAPLACQPGAASATLRFDGVMYDLAPKALAVDGLSSLADGWESLLALARVGGDLSNPASDGGLLATLTGLLFDDAERGYSFQAPTNRCQIVRPLSDAFPRTSPRLTSIIPRGRGGWLRLAQADGGAMLGAVLIKGGQADGFAQGRLLHHLATTSASLVIPVFPPVCQ